MLSSSTELTKNVELTRLQDVSGTDVYDLVAEYDGTCDAENQIVSSMYTDLVYCSTKCGDTISKGDMTDEMISAAISRSSLQCYFNEMLFEKDICDTTCEIVTEGYWGYIGTGGQVSVTSTVTWEDTSSTTSKSTSKLSINVPNIPMKFKGKSLGASYTYKSIATATSVYEKTNGGSTSMQSTIACEDDIYQWIIAQYGATEPGSIVEISTFYFACTPSDNVEGPVCPPEACGNAACDCCNVNDWASDPSTVPICTTISSSALLNAELL
eukprot:CFRG6037T1